MMLARVMGRVWCTAKAPNLHGLKLLLLQPITPDGQDKGKPVIALDAVGAGAGETVYWCRGRESSLAFQPVQPPTDASVVAIIDSITTA